jgi:hypothetical protein
MPKDKLPADNPTSALFDLAEHMSDNYHKIIYIKYYAYLFIGITIILLIILSLFLLAEGNFAFLIIFIALLISGIMLLRLVIFTKNFLNDFDKNFRAIKLVRDIDPIPKVPDGRTQLERFEIYLKNYDPSVSTELKDGVDINKNIALGKSKWSLAMFRRARSFGPTGYLLLTKIIKGEPKLGDFIKLEKKLETVAKEFMLPDRMIILYRAPKNYNGISDDLYSYLTEKNHFILKGGKQIPLKLQLFVEHAGRYEIIPLLP